MYLCDNWPHRCLPPLASILFPYQLPPPSPLQSTYNYVKVRRKGWSMEPRHHKIKFKTLPMVGLLTLTWLYMYIIMQEIWKTRKCSSVMQQSSTPVVFHWPLFLFGYHLAHALGISLLACKACVRVYIRLGISFFLAVVHCDVRDFLNYYILYYRRTGFNYDNCELRVFLEFANFWFANLFLIAYHYMQFAQMQLLNLQCSWKETNAIINVCN